MLMQDVKPMSFAWTPDYYGHGRIAIEPEPAPPEEEVGPMCHVCQEGRCNADAELVQAQGDV